MTIERIIRAVVAVVFCICVMMARPVAASEIVGITSGVFASGFKCCAALYSIDPLTGNATLLRNKVLSYSFGASGSPDAGTIFVESGFNLWEINVTTFQGTAVGGLSAFDLAFDRSTNTLYDTSGSALFSVQCPSPPGMCTETQVGTGFPTSDMQALGFVPGAGLYGVSNNFLFRINDSTGVATPVGATLSDQEITDLVFVPHTGRLIASAGCFKFNAFSGSCNDSLQGSIYLIDRFTGHATLLNGNAPMIIGLADVVPEPGSGLLLAAGLGALLVWSSRRARAAPTIAKNS